MHDWLDGFTPQRRTQGKGMESVETLLQISTFAANKALLTFYSPQVNAQDIFASAFRGRDIMFSPGGKVQKPVLSTAALVIMTILIGLQVIGLAYLAYYILHVPTWTGALDALAMARIVSVTWNF